MEFLIGIGVSVVGKVSEYTVEPVFRHIGYFLYYKRNVENLKAQTQDLKFAKERVEHSVAAARDNCGIIEGDVQHWQSKADSISEEAAELISRHEGQAITSCSCGSFPELVKRYKLGKEAKKMTSVVTDVKEAGKFRQDVAYRLPPSHSITKIKGYQEFETRKQVFKEIMETLRDGSVRKIGVWGMGGVGKTMLVQEVASQAKNENLFTRVVLTTVSQTPDAASVQEEVAETLGLTLDENTVALRAKRLRDRLSSEKKILIIIDDIWSKLDLECMGIFFGDDQNQCKILLTSRSQDVSEDMEADKIFKLELVSEVEATDLFDQINGDQAQEHEFQDVKEDILQKCAGLPLAISVVAKALKNKRISIWEDALVGLQTSNPSNIKGVEKEVYSVIRWSYDFLESEEARTLLMLCSLHKEDEEISLNALSRYVTGLRFFNGIRNLKNARNRVVHLVETLKNSSLLLDGNGDDYVKMHDVIRDVVLSIASKDGNMYFIRNAEELSEKLYNNELQDSTAISLRSFRNWLPETLPCPKLQLFSLSQDEYRAKLEIPNQYFELAKDLHVLALKNVDVSLSRLSSICFLNNLTTLTCSHSSLGDISCIGELKCLEILDLSHSDVEVVPKELGNLTRLLSLDLSYCRDLKVIEAGAISSLTRLEELSLDRSSFTHWAPLREDSHEDCCNARLTELKQARNLTALNLDIIDATNVLPDGLFNDKLERFEIHITTSSFDENHSLNDKHRLSRSLILDQVNDGLLDQICLKPLIKGAENLYLSGINITQSLSDELGQLRYLKVLTLYNVHTAPYAIDAWGASNMSAFQNLEELYLTNLAKLETVCNGCNHSTETLAKLRVIVVRQCHSLKNLFPLSFPFTQLEKLKVVDCKGMEDIFLNIKNDDEVVEFPLLLSVKLVCIPMLKQFTVRSPTAPKRNDDRFPLFHHKVAFPTLRKLKLEALDSMTMIWPEDDDELMSNNYFCNLEKLFVIECKKLTRLCSSTMLRRLQGLADVNVISCDMIEAVIVIQNPTVREERLVTIRTAISSLYLFRLPKLEYLLSYKEQCANSVTFSVLEKVEVSECSSLKSLFPASVAKTLLELESISLENCGQLQEVIADEEGSSEIVPMFVLPRLSSLYLCGLPELECLYRKLHCSEWPSLTEFTLEECGKVKILASNYLSAFREKRRGETLYDSAPSFFIGTVAFPKLKIMKLSSLDRLEMIWKCDQELVIADSFGELENLCIKYCDALIKVFSLDLLRNLESLAKLVIDNCAKVEEVFAMQRPTRAETSRGRVISNLTSLYLTSLPKLKHVWKYEKQCDPRGRPIFVSQQLKKVVVVDCPSLETLFPTSVAKELLELESLDLKDCDLIREVIGKEEGATEITPEFNLLKLTNMELSNLPELQCLYPGLHSSKWPSLSILTLKNCVKLKILASDLSTLKMNTSQQACGNTPLFVMETVMFPKLSIMSLESLDVFDSGDHVAEKSESVPSTVSVITVDRLPNSKGFMFSSSASFKHLTMLAVLRCGFTVSLFDPATARSLPQLTTMSITECKSITEVIGDAPEEGEIVFSKLKILVLACLPNLARFHSGHCALLFPILEQLVVLQCSEMRSFSSEVITPKLKGIITRTRQIDRILCLERWYDGSFCTIDDVKGAESVEEQWDGDVNSTLKKVCDSPDTNVETDTDRSEDDGDEEGTTLFVSETENITKVPDAKARTE